MSVKFDVYLRQRNICIAIVFLVIFFPFIVVSFVF